MCVCLALFSPILAVRGLDTHTEGPPKAPSLACLPPRASPPLLFRVHHPPSSCHHPNPFTPLSPPPLTSSTHIVFIISLFPFLSDQTITESPPPPPPPPLHLHGPASLPHTPRHRKWSTEHNIILPDASGGCEGVTPRLHQGRGCHAEDANLTFSAF